jgi:hypothetical protein
MPERTMLIVNLAATAFMAGVIWYVQLVHYPLMAGWPHDDFAAWEERHRQRTGMVVIPAMLLESITAAILLWRRPPGVPTWLVWLAFAVLLAIHASTFLVQVPLHERLSAGWDAAAHQQLVATNWVRTVLWTARAVLVAAMLAVATRRFLAG